MKWRIMHVDDEADIRTLVKATLEPKYEVVQANDGLDALEKLDRYEPDMILLDVMMPLMDGFEAASAIRRNTRFANTAVMFLSALTGKEEMKKGYASGANLYLTKPFEPSRLLRNIDLYFDTTPPPHRARHYSIEEIHEMEKNPQLNRQQVHLHRYEIANAHQHLPSTNPLPTDVPREMPRVMAVDDTEEILELISLSLMDRYEVVTAHNGLEAIENLVKYQPDILVIDIMMPKMNGFQLLQTLRANPAFSHLPIIICSAKASERDVSFALKNGANAFLAKPFTPEDLIRRLADTEKTPGFKVREKKMSMAQINSYQAPPTRDDIFKLDADTRRPSSSGLSKGVKQLREFLDKEGNRDALDKPEPPPVAEEPKPKRRLFGFGGDKT